MERNLSAGNQVQMKVPQIVPNTQPHLLLWAEQEQIHAGYLWKCSTEKAQGTGQTTLAPLQRMWDIPTCPPHVLQTAPASNTLGRDPEEPNRCLPTGRVWTFSFTATQRSCRGSCQGVLCQRAVTAWKQTSCCFSFYYLTHARQSDASMSRFRIYPMTICSVGECEPWHRSDGAQH